MRTLDQSAHLQRHRLSMLAVQVDTQGNFKEDNFQKAMAMAGDSPAVTAVKQKKKTDQGEDSDIFKLVMVLVERSLDPVRPLRHARAPRAR
jgi:hypothetical protein